MTIEIEQWRFMQVFGADGDYNPDIEGEALYLSIKSGSLTYVALDPKLLALRYGEETVEENFTSLTFVEGNPDQFVEIPSMSHGQHHDVIQEFLASSWIPEASRRDRASDVYYPRKSIGCWLREVNDDEAIDAYFKFKDSAILQRAEAFLRANGVVDFVWV